MGAIIYNILILPIEYFIELVFSLFNDILDNPGLSIVFVSLAVQFLVLPLYKKSDELQEQERDKQKSMEYWTKHIKKTFKGDERFMMQQAYYREMGYKPIYAIKGSLSLLLQIPFFVAGYHFLSNLSVLNGVSFIGISDLSQPDSLINIGSVTLNLLPILMTVFNIIAGIIYTKGFPAKDKIQTYALACVFLVILYNSPAGLVFYWTLNNLFSLLKNVFMKLIKHPKEVLSIIAAIFGVLAMVYVYAFGEHSIYLKIAIAFAAVILVLPLAFIFIKKKIKTRKISSDKAVDLKQINAVFYLSLAAILLLIGFLIPISVVKSSPVEFISTNYGPFGLILNIFSVVLGLTFVWVNIFYSLSSKKVKKYFAIVSSITAAVGIFDFAFFGKDLGTLSTFFVYVHYPVFTLKIIAVNLAVCAVIAVALWVIICKKIDIAKRLFQIISFAMVILTFVGGFAINKGLAAEGHPEREKNTQAVEDEKIIQLSKDGKNVIVFMIDKAVSEYIPYAFEVKPELKEMYDGFTYYPNTLSYGGSTNFATPALFGGYEYTPREINKRTEESLESKQNEALKVMPKLFSDNGYSVTICDPPYAGYKWNPDLSIYDEYPTFKTYKTCGAYSEEANEKYSPLCEAAQKRSFLYYSIMKAMPVIGQNLFYKSGEYWSTGVYAENITIFIDSYSVLEKLNSITNVSDGSENNFLMIQNGTAHDAILLQEPEYIPSTEPTEPTAGRKLTVNGVDLDISDKKKLANFQSNVSALLKVGEWLEYLKENDVYDNTRIIIVADHGTNIRSIESMVFDSGVEAERFNPLLMVKDFNSKGFTTSDEFMTNADTPSLATKGIIDNPINPFTGKAINTDEKTAHPQEITTSDLYDVTRNNGNVFDTSDGEWWAVSVNVFNPDNWTKVEEAN